MSFLQCVYVHYVHDFSVEIHLFWRYMMGRFLYRCIICLTRLVNSFLCLLVLGLVRVDFVPAGSGSADPVDSVDFAPVGFAAAGSGLDFDLCGKHVEDCGKLVVLGAFSIATFWSINRKRSVNSFQSTSAFSFCPIMTFMCFEKRSM